MRYHPAHDHWHVLDVAIYELRDEATGALAARSPASRVLLTDTRRGVSGRRLAGPTPLPARLHKALGLRPDSTQGISAGWADTYRLTLPARTSKSATSTAAVTASARPPIRSDY